MLQVPETQILIKNNSVMVTLVKMVLVHKQAYLEGQIG